MGGALNKIVFQPPPPSYRDDPSIIWLESGPVDNSSMSSSKPATRKIASYFLFDPSFSTTVLYSHGNACDIGQMKEYLEIIHNYLKVNVFAYEYSGYGISEGSPSEENVFEDVCAAFRYLNETKGISSKQIVLFGCSMGSGPTCYLGSKFPFRGVILQSPFLSIVRTQVNTTLTLGLDMFKNYTFVPKIKCPVFVIHGKVDRVVPFWNGQTLYELCPKKYPPLWAELADHNDILDTLGNSYFMGLMQFMAYVDSINKNEQSGEPSEEGATTDSTKQVKRRAGCTCIGGM